MSAMNAGNLARRLAELARVVAVLAAASLVPRMVTAEEEPPTAGGPPAANREATDSLPPLFEPTRFPLDFVTDRSDLDGTPDFDSYFGLLDYVRRVDPAALQAASDQVREEHWKTSQHTDWPLEEFPFYYDLTKRPESYRGRPITLVGHIQLHHVDHVENSYGLDPLHVAYLYTDDSQHHPARIVFTENPDRIPVGEQVVNGIQVTGYFLKLYRYHDRDGKGRFMPLVLARSVRWSPPQRIAISRGEQIGLAVIAVACLAGIVWYVRRTRRQDALAREREKALLGVGPPPDFSNLPS
jgi:hypothetical protein